MGYTTDFFGEVTVDPPLNDQEMTFLRKFAGTRRMGRDQGPYFVDGSGDFGQGGEGVTDYNRPPEGQPGLWCQWVPTESGAGIEWDGGEKFYDPTEWMTYIVGHFLKPDAEVKRLLETGELADGIARQFEGFSFDHVVNGEIEAQGEEPDDKWKLVVKDNEVEQVMGRTVYAEPDLEPEPEPEIKGDPHTIDMVEQDGVVYASMPDLRDWLSTRAKGWEDHPRNPDEPVGNGILRAHGSELRDVVEALGKAERERRPITA